MTMTVCLLSIYYGPGRVLAQSPPLVSTDLAKQTGETEVQQWGSGPGSVAHQ